MVWALKILNLINIFQRKLTFTTPFGKNLLSKSSLSLLVSSPNSHYHFHLESLHCPTLLGAVIDKSETNVVSSDHIFSLINKSIYLFTFVPGFYLYNPCVKIKGKMFILNVRPLCKYIILCKLICIPHLPTWFTKLAKCYVLSVSYLNLRCRLVLIGKDCHLHMSL